MTLVQGSGALLNDTYSAKLRSRIHAQIASRSVEIIFNDYIETFPEAGAAPGVRTRNGVDIPADLVVPTRGGRPNTAFLAPLVALTPAGHIPVAPTLEVKGHPGVFAAGDAIDWAEQKQLGKYGAHTTVIVRNVLDRLAGAQPSKQYGGSREMIVITNGKVRSSAFLQCHEAHSDLTGRCLQASGVAYLGGLVLGPWFARMVKSKGAFLPAHDGYLWLTASPSVDLLVSMHKKQLGF